MPQGGQGPRFIEAWDLTQLNSRRRHHRLHLWYNKKPPPLPYLSDQHPDRTLGTVSIFRYGAGPNGIMRTLGQYMGASGATFG